jgi:hypothetical protein
MSHVVSSQTSRKVPSAFAYVRFPMKRPTLDTVVNVAILVTCVFTVTVLVDRYRNGSSPSAPAVPESVEVGKKAPTFAGVEYGRQQSTVVMFLSSTCRFCTQSMPLYQTLSKGKSSKPGLKLLAVSVEPVGVTHAYLQSHDVNVDEVVVHSASIPTPTLLLVDQSGVIKKNWVGWQDEAASRELLRAVGVNQ